MCPDLNVPEGWVGKRRENSKASDCVRTEKIVTDGGVKLMGQLAVSFGGGLLSYLWKHFGSGDTKEPRLEE